MGWGWCWPREAVTRARWFDFRWWLTWLATSAAIWKKCLVGVCGDSCEIFGSRRSDGIAEICNRGWGGSEHVWGVNARRGRREGGVQGPEVVGASTDMCWLIAFARANRATVCSPCAAAEAADEAADFGAGAIAPRGAGGPR